METDTVARVTLLKQGYPADEKPDRVKHMKEFRQDAIILVIEQEYRANKIDWRLGLDESRSNISRAGPMSFERTSAGNWGTEQISRKELAAEVRLLKRENRGLQMEWEVLKKNGVLFRKRVEQRNDFIL